MTDVIMTEITTLKREIEQLRNALKQATAEKISLDQMCVEANKAVHHFRTQSILSSERVREIQQELQHVKNDLTNTARELKECKNSSNACTEGEDHPSVTTPAHIPENFSSVPPCGAVAA